ncbi:hypothetical protein EHF33_12685 [Deinococcus psychrotolerans]|uniref:Uncharacterized protein n=1 Tax=Deinococcus psychrotolerans TaxID=2489213 RepID=A0A3G8YDU8_9DEIO|nr:hypothetical protein [Deinococcus psychrotolerans]AZI43492.1 hypothetical protein EHF33_12685 [Deinococcus psychrotolerans]
MPLTDTRAFLERRNALWLILRQHSPDDVNAAEVNTDELNADAQVFEQALTELSKLIGWNRPRILAGLGISSAESAAEQP